jgi:hypothetical protein
LVDEPGSLDLPARNAADEADRNERARDLQQVGEHEQAAEVLELAKSLVRGKAHPAGDVPDKVGDEEQRPPPANKRRRAKMAPNRGTVGGGIAFEARRVAAVPDLAHDLKRSDEVKEWDEETANGPTRRVEEFPASENREVLVDRWNQMRKSTAVPTKSRILSNAMRCCLESFAAASAAEMPPLAARERSSTWRSPDTTPTAARTRVASRRPLAHRPAASGEENETENCVVIRLPP